MSYRIFSSLFICWFRSFPCSSSSSSFHCIYRSVFDLVPVPVVLRSTVSIYPSLYSVTPDLFVSLTWHSDLVLLLLRPPTPTPTLLPLRIVELLCNRSERTSLAGRTPFYTVSVTIVRIGTPTMYSLKDHVLLRNFVCGRIKNFVL